MNRQQLPATSMLDQNLHTLYSAAPIIRHIPQELNMPTTELIVCQTCDYSQDADTPHGGSVLFDKLQQALKQNPIDNLQLSSISCMMSCDRSCNVHLRSSGKISYLIGDLDASTEHIAMLLDYLKLYQHSDNGQVAYKLWPELIKGKFVARLPAIKSN